MTNYNNEPLTNVSNWKILGMLIAAPLMGAAFVMFLPFAGFILLGKALIEKSGEVVVALRHRLAR